jgi:hypothetical protein
VGAPEAEEGRGRGEGGGAAVGRWHSRVSRYWLPAKHVMAGSGGRAPGDSTAVGPS